MTAPPPAHWTPPLTKRRAPGLANAPLLWLAGHALLGVLIRTVSGLGTVHAVVTLSAAAGVAVLSSSRTALMTAAAYIVGSEVLWRMSRLGIFWETGKYAIAAVFLLGLARHKVRRLPLLPVVYFVLLLPSAVLTVFDLGGEAARQQISFNLSGPFALMVACCFLSQVQPTSRDMSRFALALIGPVTSIATNILFVTLTTTDIVFTNESNFETSGGFGPNQVSAVLGLGACLAFLFVLNGYGSATDRLVLSVAGMLFTAQSALTFSRGGVANALVAAAAAAAYGGGIRSRRRELLLISAGVIATTYFFVIPILEDFTGGAIRTRFEDTGLSNRDSLLREDLRLFVEHPLFGVGPGMGRVERAASIRAEAAIAHTEFSRLLAEHGVLGLLALAVLLRMGAGRLRAARTREAKAWTAMAVAWSLTLMLHSGMRVAAPSLAFGLAFLQSGTAALDGGRRPRSWRGLPRPKPDSRLVP